MSLATVPDSERLVSDFLRTHADIVALNTRIVGKTPGNTTAPSWVRVTELSAPQVNYPDYLAEAMLQFDCYASATGGQPEVNILAKTVRAVLGAMPQATHTGGVITSVRILGGPRELDTDFEPARDRKILTAYVYSHA